MSLITKLKNAFDTTTKELVLYGEDAEEKLNEQKDVLIGIDAETSQIENVIPSVERRISSIDTEIVTIKKEIEDTKRNITKEERKADPYLANSYKRQMVLLDERLVNLRETKTSLTGQVKKMKLTMKEAKIAGQILKDKIEDAKICYQMSGQIKLIGGALASVGKVANRTRTESSALDTKIDGLQKSIDEIFGGNVLALPDVRKESK